MSLLASEILRFRSRRLVQVLLGLQLLAIAVAGVIVVLRSEFELRGLPDIVLGTSFVSVALGWVLGASAIGADWHTGHMTTILTWEPRRPRVHGAKVLAVILGVFVIAVLVQACLAGVLMLAAFTTGSTEGAGPGWLTETLGIVVRTSALASAFAVFGFAIASVGRNTAAALGVAFGYLLVLENLVRGLRPQWTPWLLVENAVRWAMPGDAFTPAGRSSLAAGLYLLAVAAGLFVLSTAWFRARDVN